MLTVSFENGTVYKETETEELTYRFDILAGHNYSATLKCCNDQGLESEPVLQTISLPRELPFVLFNERLIMISC